MGTDEHPRPLPVPPRAVPPAPAPEPVEPPEDELDAHLSPTTYDVAVAFLGALHVTSSPNIGWQIRGVYGRDAAAAWITKLLDDINAVRNMAIFSNGMKTLDEIAEDYRRMVEGRG